MFEHERSDRTKSRKAPKHHNQPEYLELTVEAQIEVAVICGECEEALDAHRNINDDEKITLIVEPCDCVKENQKVPIDSITLALHCLALMTPLSDADPVTPTIDEGGFDIRTVGAKERRNALRQIKDFINGIDWS